MTKPLKQILPERMKRALRRPVDALARAAGYERVKRGYPVDFRGLTDDAREAAGRAGNRPMLLKVPIADCRGLRLMAFPLTIDSPHPFVMVAREYLANRPHPYPYEGSPLQIYYRVVQLATAADLYGLSRPAEAAQLSALPSIAAVAPWLSAPGRRVRRRRIQLARNEMAQHGTVSRAGLVWHGMGPVPDERGRLEMKRVCDTAASIADNGYRPASIKSHVHAKVLRANGRQVFVISSGQHRAAALAALGYTRIPVHVSPNSVFDRNSVAQWPAVASGALTQAQALEVFDRVFAGEQPPGVAAVWPVAWEQSQT